MEPAFTPYDLVIYPGFPYSQTHPDRLATLAHLYGMTPTPIENCRVLELGCGEGANLIPMAFQLPDSIFFGIDLAGSAIRKGRQLIASLGLANIRLEEGDLSDFPLEPGSFDYIIAHGIISWVSPLLQEKILGIVQVCLAPQGVAYISYNAMPGGHFRMMISEMMQYHLRQIDSQEEQSTQAKTLIEFLADVQTKPNSYGVALKQDWERIYSKRSPHVLYHDELSEYNHSFYFHEFMDLADRHRLQFLAEADFPEMHAANLNPRAGEFLKELDQNILLREQYLDFMKGRRFRQTLLCHQTVPLDRTLSVDRIANLLVASRAQSSESLSALAQNSPLQFIGPHHSSITTAHPLIKSALLCLNENWPLPISFRSLREKAQKKLQNEGSTLDFDSLEDRTLLVTTFYGCYGAGLLDFRTWAPKLVLKPAEYPTASSLARWQAMQGAKVTSLCHETIDLNGALEKKLIQLLDGSRNRLQILDALEKAVCNGEAELNENGTIVQDPLKVRPLLNSNLEIQLNRLGRLGLLIA